MFKSLVEYADSISYNSTGDKNLRKLLQGQYLDDVVRRVSSILSDSANGAGKLVVPCSLVPASRPRSGPYGSYLADPYKSYKTFLTSVFSRLLVDGVLPPPPLPEVPVFFSVEAYYSFPKSYSKKKRADLMQSGGYKITTPDVDNLEKAVLDALVQSGAILDDRYVVNSNTTKMWTEEPSDYFTLSVHSILPK